MRSLYQLATCAALLLVTTSCAPERPPNVLLVTFDTTRADALGCYGNDTAHTPNLDRLAAEGHLFERCFAAAPLTLPSHSTILTGTYPIHHGVRDNSLFVLPPGARTLAEIAREHGYVTGAAVASYPVIAKFGLDQGFDFYDDRVTIAAEDLFGDVNQAKKKQQLFFDERPADRVNEAFLPWLREHADEPFFAWVHYFDPHHPILPPPPYDQTFAVDPYQGEVAFADECFGRLLAALENLGIADRTIVVMTADHGEGRGDHNEATHALAAYNSTLHVPLIVRAPGMSGGGRVQEHVSSVDIMPTILELLAIASPPATQGRSLVPMFDATGSRAAQPSLYAETLAPRLSHGWGELRVLYDGPYKYIHGPRPELYHIDDDPREINDLVGERPDLESSLRTRLESFISDHSSPDSVGAAAEVDLETLQHLEALGYISSGRTEPQEIVETLRSDGTPPQDRLGDVSLWSQARNALQQEQFSDARELCLRLVEDDPGSTHYLALLARAYLGLDQAEKALEVAERATHGDSVAPTLEPVYLEIAADFAGRGRPERALGILQWLAARSSLATTQFALAQMHLSLGDRVAYREALAEGLTLDPDNTLARVARAADNAASGRLEEAEQELVQVLADSPLYPPAHYNYSRVLIDLGRPQEAIPHLERAVQTNPQYWPAHLGLIALHLDLGAQDGADQVLADLQRLSPPDGVMERAQALMEMP